VVVGDYIGDKLAPYQENNMGDCPQEYMTFQAEVKKGKEVEFITAQKRKMSDSKAATYDKLTTKQFMSKWGYVKNPDTNEWGYYYNENAKWDWYQIGGRWTGMFKMKPNRKSKLGEAGVFNNKPLHDADQAKKGDIDWKAMQILTPEQVADFTKHWEEVLSGKSYYKPEYFKEKYGTLEKYLKQSALFTTHSVLNDDGWHEAGQMGWFGCSSSSVEAEENWDNNYFKNFIEPLSDDTLLTIVDCHI
jgi:hypothetical protein